MVYLAWDEFYSQAEALYRASPLDVRIESPATRSRARKRSRVVASAHSVAAGPSSPPFRPPLDRRRATAPSIDIRMGFSC